MSAPGQSHLWSSMTILALAIVAPHALVAQTLSTRPASVALTVFVPSHLGPQDALTADGRASIVRRDASTLDVETLVGLGERPASRIEVRLGASWAAKGGR